MNLHGIVSGVIAAVNPMVAATLRISAGTYTTAPSGERTPNYLADLQVSAQVQDLSQKDLLHLDGLNVQGSQKVIYVSGHLSGINRPTQKGGDLVILADGVWLTTAVLEGWSDWCKVAVTQQMDGT